MVQGRKYIPTPDDLSAAVEMYQGGSTSIQVAKFLGVVPHTALRLLRGEGVEIRKAGLVAGSVIHRRGPTVRLVMHRAIKDDSVDAPVVRPVVTSQYLDELSRRWAEKIPRIVATALQESLQAKRSGERSVHVR